MPRYPLRSTAAAYLASRTRFGIKFGIETMQALVAALGHPERACPTLLVAGTNGKGSVVAYVDAALRASGLRVGRYISPHLLRLHERISVNGRDISDGHLEAAVERVRAAAERLVRAGTIPAHPTYFEVLTAAAFEHFRRRRVQVAVLEVGMGGRLDATNVADPAVSAIVSIDWDHETYLGRTLAAIATEKAGVLRQGRTAVVGRMPEEARVAVAAEAQRCGARLVDAFDGVGLVEQGVGLSLTTPHGDYRDLRPLPGRHQRDNLVVAMRLLEEAAAAGVAARASLSGVSVFWPGRLQWIPGEPPLLLDGAHNPAGVRALAAYVESLRPFVLLFGAMGDKDVGPMARDLLPLAREVVLTQPPPHSRAATPDEIAARAGAAAARARREPSVRRALRLARSLAARAEPVVVAGSLYLVGEVLRLSSRPRK